MICPNCSRNVPEGSFECPYCHEPIYATQRINLSELTWCPVCGALVGPDDVSCPKCSSPVRRAAGAARRVEVAEVEPRPAEPEPGLESAIPPTGPGAMTASSVNELMPRAKRLVVAAAAAVLIVGGAAVAITHPWDPDINDTSAKSPYDTSNAGNPDALSALDAQDSSAKRDDGEQASDDPVFDSYSSAYQTFKDAAEKVDASEAALKEALDSQDRDAISSGLSEARSVSIDVSNAISTAQSTSDGAGAYTETSEHLVTLGNWLRNRCDALTSAWQAASDSSDLASDSASILSTVSASSAYKELFDQNVSGWEPVKASS
ncbi:MAG: zinc ribbon domain-containing protein [Coriobacteriia bacterium]|nr:zinc ribbon domain-containing protein [Coriobacteriia bacterium]